MNAKVLVYEHDKLVAEIFNSAAMPTIYIDPKFHQYPFTVEMWKKQPHETYYQLDYRCAYGKSDQPTQRQSFPKITLPNIVPGEKMFIQSDGVCWNEIKGNYTWGLNEIPTVEINVDHGCDHKWVEYVGIRETFEYCKHCDEKRTKS